MSAPPKIDKSKEIQSIKSKFGSRYYFNPEAHKEAALLWGAECNDCGVALNRKKEVIIQVASCIGELQFVETSKGYWLLGISAQTSVSGFGYAPSVWDNFGFASYWDARAFGVEKLIKFFSARVVTSNSCSSATTKANCQRVVELLRGERAPQLDLF
ncbi:hypothetical protein BFP97_06425 [Roseivirga sp. 4D4]|uniref:hypothetical protein n=1 Tax=Roseivirga sp. 4D4 TaxID=1889784 RepID=UPI000852E0F7|nr:hypothetical protein [Roseivirga sp. 4D4]OEK01167.1 hypothetical protein BFP97_06425 [Roseivirga sp. 4D4]